MWKANLNYNSAFKPCHSSTQGSTFYHSVLCKALTSKVKINNQEVEVEIDTGATLSLMHSETFSRLFPNQRLTKSSAQLSGISAPINLKEISNIEVTIPGGKPHKLQLYVCDNYKKFTPLLGRDWLDVLVPEWRSRLWPSDPGTVTPKILAGDIDEDKIVDLLETKFQKNFTIDGTQTIEGFEARIILKPNAVPVFHKAYPVPFALRAMLDEKIDSLVKDKIYSVSV